MSKFILTARNTEHELTRIIRKQLPAMRKAFIQVWQSQRNMFTEHDVAAALLTGHPLEKWIEDWKKDYKVFVKTGLARQWQSTIIDARENFSEGANSFLRKPKKAAQVAIGFGPDAFVSSHVGFHSLNYTQTRTLTLIDSFSKNQITAVRNILTNGIKEGQNVNVIKKTLRDTVGLNERQSVALSRYERSLLTDLAGQPTATQLARMDKQIERYRNTLLESRARSIAQTELASAYANGQIDAFKEYAEKGWLSTDLIYKKEWITAEDERVCEICDGLHEQSVSMDGNFRDEINDTTPPTPPAHTNCRCSINIMAIEKPAQRIAA